MRFKQYLSEAEWVNNQRFPTTEALWHILQPLVNSSSHLLALGTETISPEKKKPGAEQGSRSDPLTGPLDPNTRAIGIRAFMNNGMDGFGDDWMLHRQDKAILHVLRINPKDVWTIDPRFNEKNPWLLMNTHWKEIQDEYKKLELTSSSRGRTTEWQNIVNSINNAYKLGASEVPYSSSTILSGLKYLFHLIYVEAPRLLSFMKKGYSYGKRPYSQDLYRRLGPDDSGPQSYDMRFPKTMKWDFRILSKTLPLTDTPWAIIIDPRAAKTENTVVLPVAFPGFRKIGVPAGPRGIPQTYARSFIQPDAHADAARRIQADLEIQFPQLVSALEEYLETLAEVIEGDPIKELGKREKNVLQDLKETQRLVAKIKAIDRNFKLPDNLRDAVRQFREMGYQQLQAAEDRQFDDEDEEQFNDMQRRWEKNKETLRVYFENLLSKLSELEK